MNRDEIIAAHLPIAWAIKNPDARSAALVKLVQVVDMLVGLDYTADKDLSGLLKRAMTNAAVDAVRDEIRHRQRVKRAFRVGGSSMHQAPTRKKNFGPGSIDFTRANVVARTSRTFEALAAKEEIAACCSDDIDRKIVGLKLLNHTNVEVSALTGLSQPVICRRLKALAACLIQRGI